jgi:hypothetical protein
MLPVLPDALAQGTSGLCPQAHRLPRLILHHFPCDMHVAKRAAQAQGTTQESQGPQEV